MAHGLALLQDKIHLWAKRNKLKTFPLQNDLVSKGNSCCTPGL